MNNAPFVRFFQRSRDLHAIVQRFKVGSGPVFNF
jgi:hypothetical protein